MNISDAAEAFLSKCFKEGVAVGISPLYKEKYQIGEHTYRFDESILEEMLSTGRCKVISQNEKRVTIMGIVGDDSWG